MAKLSEAQTATLQRGAQQVGGFISPAPKTPATMAIQAAKKLEVKGLVQLQPCFHDEPWYFRDEDTGETQGYRLTAAGFEALGIDQSEWPAYCQPDPEAPVDPQEAEQDAQDTALAQARLDELQAGGQILTGAALQARIDEWEGQAAASDTTAQPAAAFDDAGFLDAAGLAPAADQPLVTATELAASMAAAEVPAQGSTKASLRDAAAAVLAVWDAEVESGRGFSPTLAEAVNRMRLALPAAKAPKAPKAAGEPGVPKPGSKLAQVIALLSRKGGALAAEVEQATGWNNTSTRGFISSLKIKRGLAVATRKEAGTTRYWIGEENAPEALPAAEKPTKAAKAEAEQAF